MKPKNRPAPALTTDDLALVASRIYDLDNTRHLDSTVRLSGEYREAMIATIVRVDSDDPVRLATEPDVYIAGIYLGALRRSDRAPAPVAPSADAAEQSARLGMIERARDPNGSRVRKVAAALADRVVAILDGKDPNASRSDSTEDQLVIALAERLRGRA